MATTTERARARKELLNQLRVALASASPLTEQDRRDVAADFFFEVVGDESEDGMVPVRLLTGSYKHRRKQAERILNGGKNSAKKKRPARKSDSGETSLKDQAEALLARHQGALTISAVAEELYGEKTIEAKGRARAVLNNLMKSGLAKRAGRGLWQATHAKAAN
jgi:hypothetical protein